MPGFTKGPNYKTPFGKNQPLRSTRGLSTKSYTVDRTTVPTISVDGTDTQVLQPGVVMAEITASGKIGPRDPGAADGRELTANIVGVNKTFLPTQLLNRDVAVAVWNRGEFVQARCTEVTGGAFVAATNTTADAMRGTKTLDCLFF